MLGVVRIMKKLLLLAFVCITTQAQFLLDPYRFATAINTNTLNNGLVAYWKMDEVSGTRVDSGPNGLDLTDNNTVGSATGIITNSASFVAANDESLTRANNALLNPGNTDFTFCLWVYPDFTGFARVIFAKTGGAGNEQYYLRHQGGGNALEWGVSGNGTAFTTRTGGALSVANTWYFVCVWHDATANTINIQVNNGVAASTAFTLGVFAGTAEFSIGRDTDVSNNWSGRIDEVGYWDRVLTADERAFLYASGTPDEDQTCCPFP